MAQPTIRHKAGVVAQACIVWISYITLARISLKFALPPDYVTPVWPLSGLMLIVLLRHGLWWWPLIFLGDLTIAIALYPLPVAIGVALATALETSVGAWLVRKPYQPLPTLRDLRSVVAFLLPIIGISVPLGATVAASSLWFGGELDLAGAGLVWIRWWLGDVMGVIVFVPLMILVLNTPFHQVVSLRRWLEFILGYGCLGLCVVFVFTSSLNSSYILFLFAIWAALRFGQTGTTLVSFLISVFAIFVTSQGLGPFSLNTMNTSLVFLQTFLGIFTLTSLVMGALANEWKRKNQILSIRADLNAIASRSYDTDSLARTATGLLATRLNSWVLIDLVDLDGILQCKASSTATIAHLNPSAFKPGSLQNDVLIGGTTLLVLPPQTHLLRDSASFTPRLTSGLIVPLKVRQQQIGVLTVGNPNDVFSPEDIVFFEDASRRLAQIFNTLHLEALLIHSQKMEAVGRLAGGIAHDFNNLLQILKGSIDLLYDSPLDAPSDELDMLHHTLNNASDLTRQLLVFARQEPTRRTVFSINSHLQKTERMIRRLMGEQIQIQLHLNPDVGNIEGDSAQIEQVLVNLAINARDAMPDGGILSMRTAVESMTDPQVCHSFGIEPGSYIKLMVRDTGHGMNEYIKSHLFEPFFTTKAAEKGTGLGLSTSYGIIKQHRGHISVTSELGHGTTFIVYLPMVSSADPTINPTITMLTAR